MMFYKETSFKVTSIGKIPEDWEIVRLGIILTLKNGQRPKILENGYIPVFGANGIMGYTSELLVDNDFTIVIGRVGASGEVHLGKGKIWVSDNAIYSENYDKLKVNMPYLLYLLKSKKLEQFASKTTHPIITQTFLKNFLIQLPEPKEQRGIVEVLSVVDLAIGKVDEVIAKTERLKKGLMQELLTKGIEHKEFKDTKIGKTPKEWQVVRLGEVCEVGTGGTPSRKHPEYFDGDIPWVKSTEIDYGVITKTEEHITELGLQNSNAQIYPTGTLLIAMYGQGITRGKCAILGVDAAINQACASINSKVDSIHVPYLYYWCQYNYEKIRNFGQGANQPNLNLSLVRSIRVALPSFPEQREIAEILSTIDRKLELERKERTSTARIKRGLMDLLLSGKVRVKVD